MLDFSHLRAKGIEIRRLPQCPRSSAEREVITPPTDTMITRLWLLLAPLFSEHVFQQPQVLFWGDFLGVVGVE